MQAQQPLTFRLHSSRAKQHFEVRARAKQEQQAAPRLHPESFGTWQAHLCLTPRILLWSGKAAAAEIVTYSEIVVKEIPLYIHKYNIYIYICI